MTIKDLVQKLQQYPDQDMEVGVKGCIYDVHMDGSSDHEDKFVSDVTFKIIGVYDSPYAIEEYRKDRICGKDVPKDPCMDNYRRALCLS